MVSKSFLRKSTLSAQLPYALPEYQKNLLHVGQSGVTIRIRLQTERRQTDSQCFISFTPHCGCKGGQALDNSVPCAKLFSLSAPRRISSGTSAGDALSPQQVPDEELLRLLVEGDTESLSCLFRRYASTLHGIGRRILRDPNEAEDLVQEVFFYVHRKCQLYDVSKGSARSWIFQIAYTQAFIRRRQLKSIGFYTSGTTDTPAECSSHPNSGAEYDRTVEGLFGRNGWKKVLEDLTKVQKETLRLHFFEGHTFAEIAQILGQSYANVRNHYYRALEKLRRHLPGDELNNP